MGKKQFDYCFDANSSRHGLMICGACGKRIETGPYRYRDADDRYVTHHKDCSLGDPNWSRIDADMAKRDARNAELLVEAKAFRNRWNVDELDDLIESLEPSHG